MPRPSRAPGRDLANRASLRVRYERRGGTGGRGRPFVTTIEAINILEGVLKDIDQEHGEGNGHEWDALRLVAQELHNRAAFTDGYLPGILRYHLL